MQVASRISQIINDSTVSINLLDKRIIYAVHIRKSGSKMITPQIVLKTLVIHLVLSPKCLKHKA